MLRPLSFIKNTLLNIAGKSSQARRIISGLNAGNWMELDLKTDTQTFLGLAERELVKPFVQYSKGIKTAIDVGTSQGYYTLFFLTKTSAHHVFGFEPDSESLDRLSRNLELNQLQRDGRFELSNKMVGNNLDAKTATLDSLSEKIQTPCLIKVDVEEAELQVLDGAKKLLTTPGVRWILETHTLELEKKCRDLFRAYGLKTKIIDKAWWRVIFPELRPRLHNRWLIATH